MSSTNGANETSWDGKSSTSKKTRANNASEKI